jgi:hypothetical protein
MPIKGRKRKATTSEQRIKQSAHQSSNDAAADKDDLFVNLTQNSNGKYVPQFSKRQKVETLSCPVEVPDHNKTEENDTMVNPKQEDLIEMERKPDNDVAVIEGDSVDGQDSNTLQLTSSADTGNKAFISDVNINELPEGSSCKEGLLPIEESSYKEPSLNEGSLVTEETSHKEPSLNEGSLVTEETSHKEPSLNEGSLVTEETSHKEPSLNEGSLVTEEPSHKEPLIGNREGPLVVHEELFLKNQPPVQSGASIDNDKHSLLMKRSTDLKPSQETIKDKSDTSHQNDGNTTSLMTPDGLGEQAYEELNDSLTLEDIETICLDFSQNDQPKQCLAKPDKKVIGRNHPNAYPQIMSNMPLGNIEDNLSNATVPTISP